MPSSSITLSNLDFWRNLWIHQGRSAVGINHLSGNPASLLRTEQYNDVTDVCRRSQPSRRCPTAGVPIADELLNLLGQCVQDAVLRPSRADRVHRDAAPGHRYRRSEEHTSELQS